ncbi:MAG: PHP domain-containing protein [Petrotogaceae bacterium]|nr:PHP domain-containing protein [Petrotogaceae bacterium]
MILFDYHTHTNFSDANYGFDELLEELKKTDIKIIGITDHFEKNLMQSVKVSKSEYEKAFGVFRDKCFDCGITAVLGAEVGMKEKEFLPSDNLPDVSYIIASFHQMPEKGSMTEKEYWEYYMNVVEYGLKNFRFDIIGHIEGYMPVAPFMHEEASFDERRSTEKLFAKKYFSLDWYEKISKIMHDRNIAIEIHGGSKSPRIEVLSVMKKNNVKFSFGSDTHSLVQLKKHREYFDYAVKALDLKETDFIKLGGEVCRK